MLRCRSAGAPWSPAAQHPLRLYAGPAAEYRATELNGCVTKMLQKRKQRRTCRRYENVTKKKACERELRRAWRGDVTKMLRKSLQTRTPNYRGSELRTKGPQNTRFTALNLPFGSHASRFGCACVLRVLARLQNGNSQHGALSKKRTGV